MKTKKILLAVLTIITTQGCSQNIPKKPAQESPKKDITKGHMITISSESIQYRTKKIYGSDKYEREFSIFAEHFTAYQNNKNANKKGLLVIINGGLNSSAAIKKQAERQIPHMKADGYYPVFLSWDSSFLRSYLDQAFYVRNGERKEYVQPTAPFYIIGDFLTPIPRIPVTLYNQTGRFIDTAFYARETSFFSSNDVVKSNPPCSIQSTIPYELKEFPNNNFKQKETQQYSKSCLPFKPYPHADIYLAHFYDKERSDLKKLLRYSLLTPIRIPLSVFAEDIGKRAWQGMLRRTKNSIYHPGEFRPRLWREGDKHLAHRMNLYPNGLGQFSRFFQDISRCGNFNNGSQCNPYAPKGNTNTHKGSRLFSLDRATVSSFQKKLADTNITIIGHSMGAIVINELLPNLPNKLIKSINNIIYMAAAATIHDTKLAIEPTLQKNKQMNFYSLMLHPKDEARETSAWGLMPSGSLLEWIDEVLDNPATDLDRTMGKWRNILMAHHVFSKSARDRMKFVVFSGQHSSHPVKHGEFNDNRTNFWRPEFWNAKLIY